MSSHNSSQTVYGSSLRDVLRSDKLPALRNLVDAIPALSQFSDGFVQFRVVLDASIANEHLRWLLGKRLNPTATTSIHEAIVSGAVIAFAPSYIESEIFEHEEEIALDTGKPASEVRRNWLVMRESLHLYPLDDVPEEVRQLVDHDDEPYRIVRQQVGARAIFTRDPHFKGMKEPVVMGQVDRALRDYARASTVKIGVTIGSGMAFAIGVEMLPLLFRLLKGVAQWLIRQPASTQLAILCGVLLLVIHPKLRAKFVNVWKDFAPILTDIALESFSQVALDMTKASQDVKTNLRIIEEAFPPPTRTTLIMHARAVSIMAKGPLSLAELERRIRRHGYKARSSNSCSYLRRILVGDRNFKQVATGEWLFQPNG